MAIIEEESTLLGIERPRIGVEPGRGGFANAEIGRAHA